MSTLKNGANDFLPAQLEITSRVRASILLLS
jgi:hypothetical protein